MVLHILRVCWRSNEFGWGLVDGVEKSPTLATMRLSRTWGTGRKTKADPGRMTTKKINPLGSFLHGLPEAEVGSGGVGDDAEPAHFGDFLGFDDDVGAEGFGFGGSGFDVVDEDVGEPGGGRSWLGMLQHAAAR